MDGFGFFESPCPISVCSGRSTVVPVKHLSNGYEFEQIEEGGFGKVYSVTHRITGKNHALKVVDLKRNYDPESLREAAIGEELRHEQNIAQIEDFWLEPTFEVNRSIEMNRNLDQADSSAFITDENSAQMRNGIETKAELPIPEDELVSLETLDLYPERSMPTEEENAGVIVGPTEERNYVVDLYQLNDPSNAHENFESPESGDSESSRKMSLCLLMPKYKSNLTAWLKKNQLDREKFIELLRQVTTALDCIHKKEILHRDITTHNILCSSDDSTFDVTDFGLSIFLRCSCGNDNKINDGKAVGTEFFQAPEVKEMGIHSKESDIYSLGVVANFINDFYVKLPSDDAVYDLIWSCQKSEPSGRPSAEQLLGGLMSLGQEECNQPNDEEIGVLRDPMPVRSLDNSHHSQSDASGYSDQSLR